MRGRANAVLVTRDPMPAAVAGVAGSALSPSSARVSWTASEHADGYDVERRAAGTGSWEPAGHVGAGATSLGVTGPAPPTAYEFQVHAFTEPDPGRPARRRPRSRPRPGSRPAP
ncbi:fibronectin type III domain-containing protein [Jiangella ureilytica]|uniref:Fibronectin type III domain-containing protein n=1 Tax=Jiangella ureilytica TaxID=2530374 RepID=A0A4R4RVK6_9ACTN|nr:fibronectin type III domain-containing protein [Jiangella ureilytica]TDC53399.1 fibronectin type III domain-containing protein [Jiangella ureilytica]